MIAILTNNIPAALSKLTKEGSVKEFNSKTHYGRFTSDLEFFMATSREELVGKNITDFRMMGAVEEGVVDAARAQMR